MLKSCNGGIRNKIDPGPPEERNFVDAVNYGKNVKRIPTTLTDGLDALAADEVIKSSLAGDLYGIYDWYKRGEWNRFIWETSGWDVKTCLDRQP